MTLPTPDWQSDCGRATLYCGDCMTILPHLAPGSVDAIVTDPPYGTTACEWDSVIPLLPMWENIWRVCKERAAVVMTASQPFTSVLASSNLKTFRYCWVWDKQIPSGFNYARFQPMRQHEDVAVFYKLAPTYDSFGDKYEKPIQYKPAPSASDSSHMTHSMGRGEVLTATHKRKRSIIRIPKVRAGEHPTQKPVELMSYLVETYTAQGEAVLDFCMGSGTTGVACVKTGRKFIGIELEPKYFEIAKRRIKEELEANLFIGASA